MACGIYLITRKSTGQMYVGQSIHIYQRFYEHSLGYDPTSRIDRAMKKYGRGDFELKIIKCCKPRYLNRFEKLYIKILNTFKDDFHYNLTPGGDGAGFGEDNPSFKPYPTIQKGGYDRGRRVYHLVYYGKRMRSSFDKELLQKYIDDGTWIKFYAESDEEFIKNENEKLKRYGAKHPNFREDINVKDILDLLKEDYTISDISSEKNVAESVLRERLKKELDEESYALIKQHNYEKLRKFGRDNNAYVDLNDEQIYKEYHEDCLSFNEIAKKHNVSATAIKGHLERYAKENDLPFIRRDRGFYQYKDYPRIISGGISSSGKQSYILRYKSQSLKESVDYKKLEVYLNDEELLEELYENYQNKEINEQKFIERILKQNQYIEENGIQYYRVWKRKAKKGSKIGFSWAYTYRKNGVSKTFSSLDIKELERKVKDKGLVWKEKNKEDEASVKKKKTKKKPKKRNHQKESIEKSKRSSKTGIYRVSCNKRNTSTGFLWTYQGIEKGNRNIITSLDLNILKQKVLNEGLPWLIIDEDKSKKSFDFNNSLEVPNVRKVYTLWDSSKMKYRPSVFKKNEGKIPRACFSLKYNNKPVPCGAFYDFLTPELLNDLINEYID